MNTIFLSKFFLYLGNILIHVGKKLGKQNININEHSLELRKWKQINGDKTLRLDYPEILPTLVFAKSYLTKRSICVSTIQLLFGVVQANVKCANLLNFGFG